MKTKLVLTVPFLLFPEKTLDLIGSTLLTIANNWLYCLIAIGIFLLIFAFSVAFFTKKLAENIYNRFRSSEDITSLIFSGISMIIGYFVSDAQIARLGKRMDKYLPSDLGSITTKGIRILRNYIALVSLIMGLIWFVCSLFDDTGKTQVCS